MKRFLYISLVVYAWICTACGNQLEYSRFVPVHENNWHMDSTVRFDYTVTDTDAEYRMLVYVRHTERYPYQNMWLFIGDTIRQDTIEFYLADDRGRWLGNKHHGFIEMPVLFEENFRFPDTGAYYMEIRHGMRDTLLRGVTDVGLEIIRNNE